MEKKIETSALMITLDALLDTRLGTLFKHYEDASVTEILRAGYMYRVIDQFDDISVEEFKELYAQRDRETLRNAPPTPMVMLVREFVANTLVQNMNTPFHHKPKIYINVYPYELAESEIKQLIEGAVLSTQGECDVEAVRMSDEELTPVWVKEHLSILIHYNYLQWIETHCKNKNFEKTTCPEVGLLGPMVYYDKLPSKLEMDEYKKNGFTPFDDVEEAGRPFIGVKLYPLEHFSFSVPPDSIKSPG